MKETWLDHLKEREESWLPDNEVVYGSLLLSITTAYNYLLDLENQRTQIENLPRSKETENIFISTSIHAEVYRAYVVNMTKAIIGMGKYDTASIFFDKKYNKNIKLKNFYETRKTDIRYLSGIRNEVYSHRGVNVPKIIDVNRIYKLVKDVLILLPEVLGIENPKIKPR